MGYDAAGKRCKPQQETIKPPHGPTPKQTDKWLKEQAVLFEIACKKLPADVDRSIALNQYIDIWLETIAPDKLATSPSAGRSRALPESVPIQLPSN